MDLNTTSMQKYVYLRLELKFQSQCGIQIKNLKKYSKITPFIDWYKMLIPWFICYIDGKKFF